MHGAGLSAVVWRTLDRAWVLAEHEVANAGSVDMFAGSGKDVEVDKTRLAAATEGKG